MFLDSKRDDKKKASLVNQKNNFTFNPEFPGETMENHVNYVRTVGVPTCMSQCPSPTQIRSRDANCCVVTFHNFSVFKLKRTPFLAMQIVVVK
jgi:hypothetical protein